MSNQHNCSQFSPQNGISVPGRQVTLPSIQPPFHVHAQVRSRNPSSPEPQLPQNHISGHIPGHFQHAARRLHPGVRIRMPSDDGVETRVEAGRGRSRGPDVNVMKDRGIGWQVRLGEDRTTVALSNGGELDGSGAKSVAYLAGDGL
jgi:hypothetical protein